MGRSYKVFSLLACLLLIILLIRRNRKPRGRLQQRAGVKSTQKPGIKELWRLLRPKKFLARGDDGAGSWEMLTMVVLCLVRVALMQQTSELVRELDRNAMTRDQVQFWQLMKKHLAISSILVVHRQTYKYIEQRLGVVWRKKLTKALQALYFSGMKYYAIAQGTLQTECPDPDVRLTSDIKEVAENASYIFCELLYTSTAGTFFAAKLWKLHGVTWAVAPYLYLWASQVLIQVVAPFNFRKIQGAIKEQWSKFVSLHDQLVTHQEAIAALKGQDFEAGVLTAGAQQVWKAQHSFNRKILWRNATEQFMYSHWLRTFMTCFITAPHLFLRNERLPLGTLEDIAKARGEMGHQFVLFVQAMIAAGASAKILMQKQRMASAVSRVMGLYRLLQEPFDRTEGAGFAEGDHICFQGVTVVTPTLHPLVHNLSFKVQSGGALLLTGHNGAGKSSIFRCLGGLWPTLQGTIIKPGCADSGLHHDVFYIPQKPYNVVGNLHDQLTYPSHGLDKDDLTQERMRAILKRVDLEYLVDLYSEAEEVQWGDILSLGEVQRLAIARLLYHRPRFAILDECTSAVSGATERQLYAALKAENITYITISHRPVLKAYHDQMLTIGDPDPANPTARIMVRYQNAHGTEEFSNGGSEVIGSVKAATARILGVSPGSIVSLPRSPDILMVPVMPEGASLEDSVAWVRAKLQQDLDRPDSTLMSLQPCDSPKLQLLAVEAVPGYILEVLPACSSKEAEFSQQKTAVVPTARTAISTTALQSSPKKSSTLRQLLALLRLGLSRTGYARIGLILASILAQGGLGVGYAKRLGSITSCGFSQNRRLFVRYFWEASLFSALYTFAEQVMQYTQREVNLELLTRLTASFQTRYLQSANFYQLCQTTHITDPQQRLTEDLKQFCDTTADLFPSLFKPTAELAFCLITLARLAGAPIVSGVAAYLAVAMVIMRVAMPSLGRMLALESSKEGLFRLAHTRVRTYAESIAFFGGGERECEVATGRLNDLVRHMGQALVKKWRYDLVHGAVIREAPFLVQWLVRNEFGRTSFKSDQSVVTDQGVGLAAGQVYIFEITHRVFDCMAQALGIVERLTNLSGVIGRLSDLDEELRSIESKRLFNLNGREAAHSKTIAFHQVDIVTPTNKVLIEGLNLTVTPETPLMVTGPNGSGKTAFFRVLAGLWPVARGSLQCPLGPDGTPTAHDIFLVPQKVYMVTGTLVDQVTYPKQLTNPSEEQLGHLQTLFDLVGLGYLPRRETWIARQRWCDVLSLGEQQRVGLARLFYHQPTFAVLDECTSAVSIDVELKLYAHLVEAGITCLTLSERLALTQYHANELQLGDGSERGWTLCKIANKTETTGQLAEASKQAEEEDSDGPNLVN